MPDTVEWELPDAMTEISNDNGIVLGRFDVAGNYDVSITAHLGECVDEMMKTIEILEQEENPDDGRLGYEEFVKTFKVHPNPSDGRFDLTIEFLSESDITISIWNAADLKLVGKTFDYGKSLYLKQFDLRPLPAGNYLLKLDHAKGKKYIRFIVY